MDQLKKQPHRASTRLRQTSKRHMKTTTHKLQTEDYHIMAELSCSVSNTTLIDLPKSTNTENLTDKPKQKRPNRTEDCLKIGVIRAMLKKFLDEKKMAKEALASVLKITEEELEQLLFYKTVLKLKQKINLPLIKLFCETKFDN